MLVYMCCAARQGWNRPHLRRLVIYMAKRLQLKFSRVMHSFQFCRPKRFSTFPDNRPTSVIRKAYDINYPNLPALLPSTPEHSLGCRCKATSCALYFPKNLCSEKSPICCEEVEMHGASLSVGTKSRGGVNGGDELLSGSRLAAERKKGRKNNKKKGREGMHANTTSLSSRWSVGYEGDEESRRSFSNDFSYELIDPATPMIEKPSGGTSRCKKKMKNTKIPRELDVCSEERTAAGMWQMMPCSENEKVRESYVTVKKTDQPYEDFQRSMLEMILEKEILQGEELEELLQWFLALNSPQYHGMIVKAFCEIWEVLFCDSLVQE